MKNIINIILISTILFFLSACNSSSFTDVVLADEDNVSFGGVVVDGYISGATVCLDLNKNSTCDSSEPTTVSDSDGKFSFGSSKFNGYSYIPIIAKGGIDTATNKAFRGELKSIIDTSTLSQENSLIINPLTDLVAISFLRSTIQDDVALADSIQEVSDVFGLSKELVLGDPMLNTVLFVKVQEIQHLKRLIQTAADESYVADTGKSLPNEIREAIVTQIKDSVGGNLNLERVLYTVEVQLNIDIPQNVKTFIVAQVAEIKRALDEFILDTSIELANLDRLQLSLENELDAAYTSLANVQSSAPIDVVNIGITYSFITQSIFDKTDAVLDEQACLATNGYKVIKDSGFDFGDVADAQNGVIIQSGIGPSNDNSSPDHTDVQLYYPTLTSTKTDQKTIVFTDDFTLSYDNAWTQNVNKILYIQTPKAGNTLYGCFRAELNSTVASKIVITKVFRYLEI